MPAPGSGKFPDGVDFGLSASTVGYTTALVVLAALIVGVLPALQATGRWLQAGLRHLGGGTGDAAGTDVDGADRGAGGVRGGRASLGPARRRLGVLTVEDVAKPAKARLTDVRSPSDTRILCFLGAVRTSVVLHRPSSAESGAAPGGRG